jgi:hypothetical protein
MWGAKQDSLGWLRGAITTYLLSKHGQSDYWQVDQEFLRNTVWPVIQGRVLVHDDWNRFPPSNPFPSPRKGYEFVGQIFDENDQTPGDHVELLRRAIG